MVNRDRRLDDRAQRIIALSKLKPISRRVPTETQNRHNAFKQPNCAANKVINPSAKRAERVRDRHGQTQNAAKRPCRAN